MKRILMAMVLAGMAGGTYASEFNELGAKASDIALRSAMDPVVVKPVAEQVKDVVLKKESVKSNKDVVPNQTACGKPEVYELRSCVVETPVCVKMKSYTNDADLWGYVAWYTLRTYNLAISPNGQTNQFITENTDRLLGGNIPSQAYPDTPESWAKIKTVCEQGIPILLANYPICK